MSNVEEYLAYIIPTIHQRLAQDEIQEPTEEIRQLLVELLSRLIDQVKIEIGTYIDEVTQILKKTIVDPFAEVKKVIPFIKIFLNNNNFSCFSWI